MKPPLSRQEWGELYKVWRIPYLHLPASWRGRIVRGCARKIRYDSYREAKQAADRLPAKDGLYIHCYSCDLCQHWHIGNGRIQKPNANRIYLKDRT